MKVIPTRSGRRNRVFRMLFSGKKTLSGLKHSTVSCVTGADKHGSPDGQKISCHIFFLGMFCPERLVKALNYTNNLSFLASPFSDYTQKNKTKP